MLTPEFIKKIHDFVYLKPRTVEEISEHIKKNWRTANRYIEKIAEQQGSLAFRTFREGTRGALKIVYWSALDKHSGSFQSKLLEQIEKGKNKNDFSPFDIYQHVDAKRKEAFMEESEAETVTVHQDLVSLLRGASRQILLFSGNLSWSNLFQGKTKILDVFEEIATRGVNIKVLSKADIDAVENIKKFLSINSRLSKEIVEVRHHEQPLRAIIIDSRLVRLKEIRETGKKKNTYIFYDIYDKEWIEWLQKVFWGMFSASVDAEKRIKELMTIQRLT